MNEHPYLNLRHYNDGALHCGPVKTVIGIVLIVAVLIIPTALIFHRVGYVRGVESGVAKTQQAIDASIREGIPFAFVNGDVHLVATVKTDSKWFRQGVRERANRYELVRYRAGQYFGPDGDDAL